MKRETTESMEHAAGKAVLPCGRHFDGSTA
jgi:hypothetical protein